MFEKIEQVEEELRAVVVGLDPVGVPLPDVEAVWACLDRVERLAAGAKLRLAGRVEEAAGWRRAGRRSAADHLAVLAGVTVGHARGMLDASRQLGSLPVVDGAVATGSLSTVQAQSIADAAVVAPAAQSVLVAAAGRESVSELRERCARTKAAADADLEARHRRIHASRFFRKRSCADGAVELSYRSTPQEGAEVWAVAQAFGDRVFRAAHRAGRTESSEAYLADGLLAMARRAAAATSAGAGTDTGRAASPQDRDHADARGGAGAGSGGGGPSATADPSRPPSADRGSGRSRSETRLPFDTGDDGTDPPRQEPPTGHAERSAANEDLSGRVIPKEVVVRVDWDALVRGWPAGGEVCELPGIGPVPVSAVRAMAESGDAVLKAVVTRGVDVVTVAHLGRRPSAAQRTALRWRDLVCVEPGCGQRAFLEIDHTVPWATSRITLLQLLEPRCRHHHRAKTGHDLATIAAHRHRTGGGPAP